MTNRDFFALLAREVRQQGTAVLLTVLPGADTPGLPMPEVGAKALVRGGVPLPQEETLLPFWKEAAAALPRELPCEFTACGARLLAERLTRRPSLIICGGGHISGSLAEIGALLDFDVTVIDDRPEFANSTRFPKARVLCRPFAEALANVEYGPSTFFVIVTRGHSADRECLELILGRPTGYIGMIGSKRKVAVVMEQLAKDGFDRERLAAVYAPIGLKIGAQTPAEIAVCIAAQLIQVRRAGAAEGCMEDAMLSLLENPPQEPMAMATVISKTGSAPRSTGARMLMLADGTLCGSIGGGAGEGQACAQAKRVLEHGSPVLLDCDMTNEDAKQQGMVCGGKIAVFLERIC